MLDKNKNYFINLIHLNCITRNTFKQKQKNSYQKEF